MDFLRKGFNHEQKQKQQQQQPLHHHLHHALNTIQTHLSNIIHPPRINIPHNNNPFCSISSSLGYLWRWKKNQALSEAEIKKRMAGIPVYECSDYLQDPYVFLSNHDEDKRILFFYLSKRDAEDNLHEQLKRVSPGEELETKKVLDIPLSNFVEYEGWEIPIRLVPDSSQVKHAIHEITKKSDHHRDEYFSGVPVFQSECLTIKDHATGKKYRPAYLKKEDLEDTIAALVKPENRKRDIIQVAALEDIIQEMKDSSISKSNDILFIGSGITSWTWDGSDREHQLS